MTVSAARAEGEREKVVEVEVEALVVASSAPMPHSEGIAAAAVVDGGVVFVLASLTVKSGREAAEAAVSGALKGPRGAGVAAAEAANADRELMPIDNRRRTDVRASAAARHPFGVVLIDAGCIVMTDEKPLKSQSGSQNEQ